MIAADSISTASAPVEALSLAFSAAVMATRGEVQKVALRAPALAGKSPQRGESSV
jgi:hypothetical protein